MLRNTPRMTLLHRRRKKNIYSSNLAVRISTLVGMQSSLRRSFFQNWIDPSILVLLVAQGDADRTLKIIIKKENGAFHMVMRHQDGGGSQELGEISWRPRKAHQFPRSESLGVRDIVTAIENEPKRAPAKTASMVTRQGTYHWRDCWLDCVDWSRLNS